jgi:ferredoxin-thioredoxin reductase catalytic subunit
MIFKLTENKELLEVLRQGFKEKGGYCPCKLEDNDDNICPCSEFINEGICHCGFFVEVDNG